MPSIRTSTPTTRERAYIAFEWLHPYELQDLVARILNKAGLDGVNFHPFVMPIDLPFQGYDDPGTNSHTLKRDNGERMCMRGALYQPWCHMTAVKPIG
jgi:hypothetical protein